MKYNVSLTSIGREWNKSTWTVQMQSNFLFLVFLKKYFFLLAVLLFVTQIDYKRSFFLFPRHTCSFLGFRIYDIVKIVLYAILSSKICINLEAIWNQLYESRLILLWVVTCVFYYSFFFEHNNAQIIWKMFSEPVWLWFYYKQIIQSFLLWFLF